MHRKVFFLVVSVGVIATGFALKTHRTTCLTGCAEYDVKSFQEISARLAARGDTHQPAPVAVCFAEGTDPLVVNAFQQALYNAQEGAWPRPNDRYQLNTRWTGTSGDPFTIRWSFVPDGLSISNGVGEGVANSTLFASMDAKFGGNRALWISKFEQFFARWSALSGLKYQRVTDGTNDWDDGSAWGTAGAATRGDVRISSKVIDGASGILAYNFFPQSGDMVIDSADNWASSANDYRFLRNTLAHEHGHGMGLNHVCPTVGSPEGATKLMEPYLATGFDGPQQDDIRAANRHYGDPLEPDNTIATASNQGSINVGGSIVVGTISNAANATNLSIDADGEQDFFKITTLGPLRLTATATPVGTTYLSGVQDSACNTGVSTPALSQANLAIQVQNSAGVVLNSASAGALGVAESTFADLPVAGTYYVRVYETDAPTQSQLYRLNVGATVVNSTISGRITFQDWVNPSSALPLTITVRNATTNAVITTMNTTTATNGDYSVTATGLSPSTSYKIQANSTIWLQKSTTITTPAALNISGLNFNLINGDVDLSGEVDAVDIDLVIAHFGETSPSFYLNADVDGSLEIDAVDIDVVIANFGATDN